MTAPRYRHLGDYGDLVAVARGFSAAPDPPLTSAAVRSVIGFDGDDDPIEPQAEGRWSRDGVDGEAVSWSVGYGPRTQAWLLRPTGLVQYLRDDALFPEDGMRAADSLLRELYAKAGDEDAYVGEFYPGPHRFDLAMQESAFAHLARWLR